MAQTPTGKVMLKIDEQGRGKKLKPYKENGGLDFRIDSCHLLSQFSATEQTSTSFNIIIVLS